jgi:thiamine-phosphate pyrophosphorylase
MKRLPRLYAIADASFGDPVQHAHALFQGGARLIQLRNKQAAARDLLNQAERILGLVAGEGQVIVNDRSDVALVAEAAGVHLGQSDILPAAARQILGPDRIIGLSTHNLEQALDADEQPVDYVAVGPIFRTRTKENPEPELGTDGLAAICKRIHKPVVAIGGIRLDDVQQVLDAGASSIAAISDLLDTKDVVARTREWLDRLQGLHA